MSGGGDDEMQQGICQVYVPLTSFSPLPHDLTVLLLCSLGFRGFGSNPTTTTGCRHSAGLGFVHVNQ